MEKHRTLETELMRQTQNVPPVAEFLPQSF